MKYSKAPTPANGSQRTIRAGILAINWPIMRPAPNAAIEGHLVIIWVSAPAETPEIACDFRFVISSLFAGNRLVTVGHCGAIQPHSSAADGAGRLMAEVREFQQ